MFLRDSARDLQFLTTAQPLVRTDGNHSKDNLRALKLGRIVLPWTWQSITAFPTAAGARMAASPRTTPSTRATASGNAQQRLRPAHGMERPRQRRHRGLLQRDGSDGRLAEDHHADAEK